MPTQDPEQGKDPKFDDEIEHEPGDTLPEVEIDPDDKAKTSRDPDDEDEDADTGEIDLDLDEIQDSEGPDA